MSPFRAKIEKKDDVKESNDKEKDKENKEKKL